MFTIKRISLLLALKVALCFGMGNVSTPKIEDIDENERAMSHVNYIQYELAKIRISGDKFTVVKEMDGILNTIEPTSMKDTVLTNAYKHILISLNELRATDAQQDILETEMEQKRKNAIFNSFSGLGAAFLNPNPVSLVSALVMTGFNYAKTVNDIESEGNISNLKITETKKNTINEARINLWVSASKLFKDVNYESTTFINEKMMDDFIKEDFKLEASRNTNDEYSTAKSVRTYLTTKEIENQFRFFIPYYVTLLKASYIEKDAGKIKMYYKKIYNLSNAEYKNFYTKNPYLYEATKYVLLYLMNQENDSIEGLPVEDLIEIFKKEGDKTRVSVIEDTYFLIGVYEFMNIKKKGEYSSTIKEALYFLKDLKAENDTTDLYSKYKCLESKNKDNDYCLRLSKKIAEKQLKEASYEFENDGSFKITLPFDAEVSATCSDLDQGMKLWGALDRRDERQKCLNAVSKFNKEKDTSSYIFRAYNVAKLEHEKINITIQFQFGKWKGSAYGIAVYKNENPDFLEIKDFK